ncbi:ATP-binding protein [uncultured Bacteroides sp.]|uniref:ATP-binding protein n=1 Tax=uncultured Bacteroides sp. TaxID=162156 RepID=UPI0025E5F5A8|nr:ATP-binding protein [uncultured Bacteroides sp.]
MRKLFIVSIFLMLLPHTIAQNVILSPIPTHNQLPVGDIVRTFQDSEGYMWYGTGRSGLYRDDGYNIKAFRSDLNTPDILESNSITCIAEDKERQIWFGTRRGTYILDKKSNRIRPLSDATIKNWVINAIHAGSDGSIWVATGNVLHRYNPKEEKLGTYSLKWNEDSPRIYSIYEDRGHTIWIILWKGGLLRYNADGDTFIPYPWNFQETPTCIIQDYSAPYYWIGTWGKGIIRFDPNEKNPEQMFVPQSSTTDGKNLQRSQINSMAQDSILHHIWISATDDLYAYEVTPVHALQPVSTSGFLSSDKKIIHDIRSDRPGNLWISSYYPNSFILSFRSDKTVHHTMPQVRNVLGRPIAPIRLIFENGYYWFWQMRTGLCTYELSTDRLSISGGSDLLTFSEKSNTPEGGIFTIKKDSSVQHIRYIDHKIKESTYCVLPVKRGERIRTLHEDTHGNLWLGTNHSLVKYIPRTKQFQRVWENTGIINYIGSSRNDDIFVATESNGFLILSADGRKIQHFPYEEDSYESLSVTPQQNVWVRTSQSRIYFYHSAKNTFTQQTFEYDLSRDVIYEILCDDQNNLWILTDQKIMVYNPDKKGVRLIRCSDPSIKLDNFQTIYKDDNGKIHIGGSGGILVFLPQDNSLEPENNPVIKLTDVRINGMTRKAEDNGHTIILEPDERNLELYFSTFRFPEQDKIRFAFRYKGNKAYWNYLPEGQNNIYLTELSKGDYELEIKATNENGLWNESKCTVLIRRLPAWYETWQAYTLYMFLFLGITCLVIYKYIAYQKKKQLLQIEEQVAQMKYRFFTNISHELRTPLTLIITPLENLVKKVTDTTVRQQLELISRNAQNLLNLVNQLLDFRKVEMGGETLAPIKGDIECFLFSIYSNFQLTATEKGIQLEYQSELSSYYLFFDPDKLRKIVNNLLSNAIKFTPEQGKIILSVNEETKDGRKYIVIKVMDTGRGIPANELSCIFERFHQVNTNTTENNTGSGIGLHLVKEYTTLHRGFVSVQSEPEKGSVFSVYIPGDLAPNVPIKNNEEKDENISLFQDIKKKLLIVEDNDEFRFYMKNELSLYYTVYEASNGKEGEQQALEKAPDIIITDLMMPEMDGLELCHQVKNNINISHIPVILLTANDNIENEKKGYKEGADTYISKPFHWDILLSRIRNLIEQKRERQQAFEKDIKIDSESITISSLDEQLLSKLLEVVEKNMSNSDYSIEELSRDMAMSRATLYRKTCSITDNTPTEFVKVIRLKKAAELLKQGQLSIAEIAYTVGFSTPSYFTQSFKKVFGVLPTQYGKMKGHSSDEDLFFAPR